LNLSGAEHVLSRLHRYLSLGANKAGFLETAILNFKNDGQPYCRYEFLKNSTA